jgi:hypothetical protein
MPKTTPFLVHLSDDQLEVLRERKAESGVPVAEQIRRAIAAAMPVEKKSA